MEKKLNILLLAGSGALNLKVVYCLNAIDNIKVHICSSTPDNLVKFSRYKEHFFHLPWIEKPESCIANIKQYCIDNKINIIIPGDVNATAFLFEHQNSFPAAIFPCCSKDMLDQLDNKWRFAKTLLSNHIRTPKTLLLTNKQTIKSITDSISFPIMVKPIYGESSHGVVLVENQKELMQHLEGNSQYAQLPLIVQEYIPGIDIDLSFIAKEGKILISDVQRWLNEDELSFEANAEVSQLSKDIVCAFNYSGVGHFDMRLSSVDNLVYVIECNPRFWFSITAAMAQGLNFVEQGINYTLGKPFLSSGAKGCYLLPKKQLKSLLSGQNKLSQLTQAQRHNLTATLFDPLPHLVDLWRK